MGGFDVEEECIWARCSGWVFTGSESQPKQERRVREGSCLEGHDDPLCSGWVFIESEIQPEQGTMCLYL